MQRFEWNTEICTGSMMNKIFMPHFISELHFCLQCRRYKSVTVWFEPHVLMHSCVFTVLLYSRPLLIKIFRTTVPTNLSRVQRGVLHINAHVFLSCALMKHIGSPPLASHTVVLRAVFVVLFISICILVMLNLIKSPVLTITGTNLLNTRKRQRKEKETNYSFLWLKCS